MSTNKAIVIFFSVASIVFGLGLGLFLVKNPRRCAGVAFQASSLYKTAPRDAFDIEASLVKGSGIVPKFSYVISSMTKPLIKVTVSGFTCKKIEETPISEK